MGNKVDVLGLDVRIVEKHPVESYRDASIRLLSGGRLLLEGPIYIFTDLSSMVFPKIREYAIATVDPKSLVLELIGVPRGTRIKVVGVNGTTIEPGMVRILPASKGWAA